MGGVTSKMARNQGIATLQYPTELAPGSKRDLRDTYIRDPFLPSHIGFSYSSRITTALANCTCQFSMSFLAKFLPLSILAMSSVRAAKILRAEDTQDVVPNSYIVVMNDGVSDQQFDTHRNWAANVHHFNVESQGGTPLGGMRHTFNFPGMKGYSGAFDETTVNEISENPLVSPILHLLIINIISYSCSTRHRSISSSPIIW